MGKIIVSCFLILFFFGTGVLFFKFALDLWKGLDGIVISNHGLIALVLCIFLISALATGLMFLVFYSARNSYDNNRRN